MPSITAEVEVPVPILEAINTKKEIEPLVAVAGVVDIEKEVEPIPVLL